MDSILAGLNEHQKCAVTCPSSVLQVLAPPGSGKTKTLTTRVAYHIAHEGLKPWNIIVCTFTNKAAREMKGRIRSFVGDNLEQKLVLGTFHSVARRYLVKYGHYIGIRKNFGIADSADSLSIIKRIVKRHDFTTEPAKARSRISRQKSGMTNEKPAKAKQDVEQQEFEAIFTKYEEALQASNLLDYDDLLLQCVELLKRYPECVCNIEAVLIDEFQDTNHVQYELLSLFAQHRKPRLNSRVPSITIVGDPDQSIYSFRSAEIKNLTRMRSQYSDTQVVLLEDNYRSSGSILYSALQVIEQDESRPPKKLLATHTIGERPVLRTLPSSAAEAAWVVSELQRVRTLTAQMLNFSDFAILLRSASLSRHIESALGKAGIPYRMVGGHKFFDRIEVKILLDYLRVISQPDHNDALARIINIPSRKIGEVTIKSLIEEAEKNKRTLWSLVLDISKGRRSFTTKISPQAQKGLELFTNVILTSQQKLNNIQEPCTVVDLIAHVLKKLSYKEYLAGKYPEEIESRWANVEELIFQASEKTSQTYEVDDELFAIEGVEQSTSSEAEELLTKFLANVALSSAVDANANGEDTKQVTISTIHAAKGLEWPVVFIPAAYQGSIPHSRAEDTDEERRLLYVGMTRAKALLYLSYPKKSSGNEFTIISPFLSSPSVADCFATRGPRFGFSVTQDLARILDRTASMPSNATLQAARLVVDRPEDDLWPEDGEEIPTENPRWNHRQLSSDPWTSNYSSDPLTFETASKRIKTSHSTFAKPSMGGASILDSDQFSIANTTITTGFVTAGVHMKEVKTNMAVHKQAEKPDRTAEKRPISTQKKSLGNQGSIHSFFTKSASTTVQPVPDRSFQTIKATGKAKQSPLLQPQQGWRVPLSTEKIPLKEVTNKARSQPANLPSFLSNHKLKSTQSTRPQRALHSEESSNQRYVLLSSSPIKPDSDHQNGDVRADIVDEKVANENLEQPTPYEGFTRATTIHTTTMARLSTNQHSSQKKTLGMRRSVQGWGSRVNQPFSAPGRPYRDGDSRS